MIPFLTLFMKWTLRSSDLPRCCCCWCCRCCCCCRCLWWWWWWWCSCSRSRDRDRLRPHCWRGVTVRRYCCCCCSCCSCGILTTSTTRPPISPANVPSPFVLPPKPIVAPPPPPPPPPPPTPPPPRAEFASAKLPQTILPLLSSLSASGGTAAVPFAPGVVTGTQTDRTDCCKAEENSRSPPLELGLEEKEEEEEEDDLRECRCCCCCCCCFC